jgi:membrane-associated phospholipid phosphatase
VSPREVFAAPVGPAADRELSRWALGAAGAFLLLYVVSVGTGAGQRLDDAAMQWLSAVISSRGWAVQILGWVSVPSLLALSGVIGLMTWMARGRAVALLGVLTTGVIVVAAQLLKLVLQRPDLMTEPSYNSFPSGHVSVIAGLAAALLLGTAPGITRRIALVLLTPVVGLAGLATVVLQWHRPSDALGSVLLAVAVGGVALLLADGRARRRTRSRTPRGVEQAAGRHGTPVGMLAPLPTRRVDSGLRTGSRG